ncbi:ML5 [Symbiodinium natans]|uniref:ML5 protein n=1 Tax=Symbiodinium natans TaxID=878477 RepID=A0A812UVB2_9DINO|nr:ML5 [Symbiodinium natans]
MMRNLPNKYTQRMLLLEVNHAGFLGAFDFFYLPIDTETGANRGYAFLNFLDPALAWMFRLMYEGRKMSRFNSSKVITVVPATLQGFEANYMHYAFSRVSRGDPAARPLFLRAAMAWSESDGRVLSG